MPTRLEERQTAVHLLRAGRTVDAVAEQLGRSPRWVRNWRQRYRTTGWHGLRDESHAAKTHGTRIPDSLRQAIVQARSELEAEATLGTGLKYIGAPAVRTRLKAKQVEPLPSLPSIERVLRAAGMTHQRQARQQSAVVYPHLKPTEPHYLCQVDIVPHFLTGGQRLACFNAIDVVSRYPTGQATPRRRAAEAAAFLVHVWQTLGIARYTQVDNESCFSGGSTHPYVLGKVVRLALHVGTELVFSPVHHPESNGTVERFHQDYNDHVWDDTYLTDQAAVQRQADHFFQLYRQSRHHSALQERTPHEVHQQTTLRRLEIECSFAKQKLPLREGRIHFIRRVGQQGTVSVLNVDWPVPNWDGPRGVWVTIEFDISGATLAIYDAAPDVGERTCVATYPFPFAEAVLSAEQLTPAQPAQEGQARASRQRPG